MPENILPESHIENRLIAIEKDIETINTHFATKADLERTKAEIVRWVIGMSFASPALLVTVFGLAKKFGLLG